MSLRLGIGAVYALVLSAALCTACRGVAISDDPVDAGHAGAGTAAPDASVDSGSPPPTPPAADAGDRTRPTECTVEAPTECPTDYPLYEDIAPLIEANCVECHNGVGDMWPLSGYSHVADWGSLIRAVLFTCSMPPADSELFLTKEESELILTWIRCGMPIRHRN